MSHCCYLCSHVWLCECFAHAWLFSFSWFCFCYLLLCTRPWDVLNADLLSKSKPLTVQMMLLEMHSGAIAFEMTLFRAQNLFDYFLCSLQWRQLHVKLPNAFSVWILRYSCIWRLRVCVGHYFIDCYWCWIALWYLEIWLIRPPVLGFAESLVEPPLQMLTVHQLICLLQISWSSSTGLYRDAMPCALYHMLFAVVKGGKALFGDAQIRSRGSMPFFLSFRSEKIKGMLLAAHSLELTNSLFKALAATIIFSGWIQLEFRWFWRQWWKREKKMRDINLNFKCCFVSWPEGPGHSEKDLQLPWDLLRVQNSALSLCRQLP